MTSVWVGGDPLSFLITVEENNAMDPKSEPENPLSDVLSGFNANEIVDDPDHLEDDGESDAPAATPDSPNPI